MDCHSPSRTVTPVPIENFVPQEFVRVVPFSGGDCTAVHPRIYSADESECESYGGYNRSEESTSTSPGSNENSIGLLNSQDHGAPSLGRRMISEISSRTSDGANRLLDHGKTLLELQTLIPGNTMSDTSDVPRPLSFLCFVGGVALAAVSAIGLLNIFTFLVSPTTYVMQVYLLLFGLVTITVESNLNYPYVNNMKPFLMEWMKFMSIVGGRGAFYVFIGTVAVSLWSTNFFQALSGLYYITIGILCVMNHMSRRRSGGQPNSGNPEGASPRSGEIANESQI